MKLELVTSRKNKEMFNEYKLLLGVACATVVAWLIALAVGYLTGYDATDVFLALVAAAACIVFYGKETDQDNGTQRPNQ